MVNRIMNPKSAVILGGGLAKGYGGIALIRLLQENNLEPLVIGTSAGAQLAALYSVGYTWQELVDVTSTFKMSQMASFPNFLKTVTFFLIRKSMNIMSKYLEEITERRFPI